MRKDVRNEIIRIGGDNINKSEMARIMGCLSLPLYLCQSLFVLTQLQYCSPPFHTNNITQFYKYPAKKRTNCPLIVKFNIFYFNLVLNYSYLKLLLNSLFFDISYKYDITSLIISQLFDIFSSV